MITPFMYTYYNTNIKIMKKEMELEVDKNQKV